MRAKIPLLALAAIVLLGAFLRFYRVTETPPGLYPDEAMNGNNALEALATGDFKIFYPENNGREGLFINLQALSLWLFGNEPWALRVVSALFGTLTILGIYLVTRELFSSQIQNPKSKIKNYSSKSKIESTKWTTKILHFAFCILHFGCERHRIRSNEIIALLSAFFIATSYWHLNFSRIGFRAITVPFFATFGMYFLLRGLRLSADGYSSSEAERSREATMNTYGMFSTGSNSKQRWRSAVYMMVAGIFIGLGFHTYIAFRFMPFVLAVPLGWYLWRYYRDTQGSSLSSLRGTASEAWRDRSNLEASADTARLPRPSLTLGARNDGGTCVPCSIALFFFVTFVVALPMGVYFLQHPQDFFGRGGQVAIFSGQSPLYEFGKSTLQTLGMFFWQGDCNWRHNYNCQPQLNLIVAAFFTTGLILVLARILNPNVKIPMSNKITSPKPQNGIGHWSLSRWTFIGNWNLGFGILLIWFFAMMLPAILTREGLPHALRSIGMLPPVMILAGLGAWWSLTRVGQWLAKQKERWPEYRAQLERIGWELGLVFGLALVLIPLSTYRAYFITWAYHRETYDAFSSNYLHIGQYLRTVPQEVKKYVIVNAPGVQVRGLPMSVQTVMFLTDTFREAERTRRSIHYVLEPEAIVLSDASEPAVIVPLDASDQGLVDTLKTKFPGFTARAPGDFLVLQNFE